MRGRGMATSRPALEAAKIIEQLMAEIARWKKAVEGLTPGGSEYADDPEACARAIRHSTSIPKMVLDLRAKVAELQAENERLKGENEAED